MAWYEQTTIMAAYQRLSAAAAGATAASYAAMAMDLTGRRAISLMDRLAISPMGYAPKAIRGRGRCQMKYGTTAVLW